MKSAEKQKLKAQAHALKPIILLGNKGLTTAIVNETHIALMDHELIKVKINGPEKTERLAIANELCQQLQATLIQLIGNIAIIYRKNPKNAKQRP